MMLHFSICLFWSNDVAFYEEEKTTEFRCITNFLQPEFKAFSASYLFSVLTDCTIDETDTPTINFIPLSKVPVESNLRNISRRIIV